MKSFVLLLLSCFILGTAPAQSRIVRKVDSLISAGNFPGARQVIQGSSSNTEEIQVILDNRIAEINIMEGRLDEGETELKSLVLRTVQRNPVGEAVTRTNLGFLYLNKARTDLAMEELNQALGLFQKAGAQSSPEAAKCLGYVSLVFLSTGKLNQAEENGLQALQIREATFGKESEEVAASYNDLGLVYGQSDIDKALEYYESALAIYEKLHGQEHRKIAIASNNIGAMYRAMKLYGDAINNFEKAESIWKKTYPDGHPNEALAYVNLGLTYKQMGDLKTAAAFFDKALLIFKKSYGEKHSDISAVLNEIGILRQSEGKLDEAIDRFQDAICANTPGFNSKLAIDNPKVSEHYNGKVLLYSMRLKAEALEARHFGKTLKLEDLKLALRTFSSCDTLVDIIRFNSSNENDKIELASLASEVYEGGVRVSHAISEMTLTPKPFRLSAFYFAEKSKSAVLQESIADAEAKSFAGIPTDLLEKEKDLKSTIALLSQKLSQKPTGEQERLLRENLFTTKNAYDEFVKRLEKEFPDYYNLKFNRASPSVEEIQKILNGNVGVASYYVAEKGQRLYSFVLTNTSFKIYSSKLPDDFDKLLKGFNNSMFFGVTPLFRLSAERLSTLLLRGIPSTPELVVIPSGRLSTIPFEALLTGNTKEQESIEQLPFLIKRQAISYEFSAGLMLQKTKSKSSLNTNSIFLCAPISFPEEDHLGDLPGTELEVSTIATLFGPTSRIAKGDMANETVIKSGDLSKFKYLHFATHGVVDELSPELSRIFLQPSPSEDGHMYSGEIFNLSLNADLAVLSACQTGLGKFSKGEGVIGLSRALVYAGAKSIMVSYWSVADESTSQLMSDFYEYLLKQPQPDFRLALQQAKAKMIANKKFAAPYYWAPFVLIGF